MTQHLFSQKSIDQICGMIKHHELQVFEILLNLDKFKKIQKDSARNLERTKSDFIYEILCYVFYLNQICYIKSNVDWNIITFARVDYENSKPVVCTLKELSKAIDFVCYHSNFEQYNSSEQFVCFKLLSDQLKFNYYN